ncbi:hypothetical protein [Frankia gtarii]|uniref:hypothetical protein n=1 Tax=Frankia gtarii TaxID=2950102 RepID=UPI0021C18115|nr:hypothetical protein [Frankia gtarii]
MEIDIASLAFSVITATFTGYIALIGLRFTAKPHLRCSVTPDLNDTVFRCGETIRIEIMLNNRGHWYGNPVATDVHVWFDLDPRFEPIVLHSGWADEHEYRDTRIGKGGAKTIRAKGLISTYGLPPERMRLTVKVPDSPGEYSGTIITISGEGSHDVDPLTFRVVS